MKKIIIFLAATSSLLLAELPSYQCVDTHEANFITHKGDIEPKVKETSHRSKLNVSLVVDSKESKKYIKSLRVNGNDFHVTMVSGGYVYAVEFTAVAMNTWVFFENKNGDIHLTLSKTYKFFGAPMTSYSLYSCEKVNNSFL